MQNADSKVSHPVKTFACLFFESVLLYDDIDFVGYTSLISILFFNPALVLCLGVLAFLGAEEECKGDF